MQDHLKTMIGIYDELSVIGEALDDGNIVIYLLSSLPGCYDTFLTALVTHEKIPKLAVVTESLLHEEQKLINCNTEVKSDSKAFLSKSRFHKLKYYQCSKIGHIKRYCRNTPKPSLQ